MLNHLHFTKLLENNKKKINSQWSVIFYSWAARNTFLYIPELKIAFDAGLSTEYNPSTFFISHAHYDHVRDLPSYFMDNKSPTIIVPVSSADNVKTYVMSALAMSKHNVKQNTNMNIITTSPRDNQFMPNIMTFNNVNFKIELFECTHSVQTTGYGFIKLQPKLKNEFIGKDQKEIDNAKKNGIEICAINEFYEFVVLGDTNHKIFYEDSQCTKFNKNLEKYSVIIVECTFLLDDKQKDAKNKKHMLWSNLYKYIEKHPNQKFMLYHFSMCYTSEFIVQFFEELNLPNVIPLVHSDLQHDNTTILQHHDCCNANINSDDYCSDDEHVDEIICDNQNSTNNDKKSNFAKMNVGIASPLT